jgi:2'-5' RNA ligase
MRQYSPASLIRFHPHITLMFPFVPFDQIEPACETLRHLVSDIAPFEVTLVGYGEFPGVVYMKPGNPAPVQALFRQLYDAFPDYPPYEGEFGDELKPHMTVVQLDDDTHSDDLSLPDYDPITFQVDRLHVWYGVRHQDLPWVTYAVIPLRR